MCKVRRRSPRSSSSSAASRTILLTRPLLGACVVAGALTPLPPGAETPISGSAGDEEPQHHFGATSGIRIAKMQGKRSESGAVEKFWRKKFCRLIWIPWLFFLNCGIVLNQGVSPFNGSFDLDAPIFHLTQRSQLNGAGLIQRAALTLSALVAPSKLRKLAAQLPRGVPATLQASRVSFPSLPLQPPCALLVLSTFCTTQRLVRRDYL